MKKAIMFLGFAMCATFAFAQTNIARHAKIGGEKIKLSELKQQSPVDYKASIFTKEDGLDTVKTFTFSTDPASTYEEIAVITATDRISSGVGTPDSAFGNKKHSVTAAWSQWKHFNNTAEFKANLATNYPNSSWVNNYIPGYMDTTYNETDDGFMCIVYDGGAFVGVVNTYFTLPTFTRTLAAGDHKMVVIGLTQCYAKYYDQCFIDYKIGNTWYTREVNVQGVDVDVNYLASRKIRITMPYALSSESDITLRLRAFSPWDAGNSYGYFWALDNIAIITNNNTKSWTFNSATALDGFYGTMPEGMTIPMTYGINVRNTNVTDINGAKISVKASANNYATSYASSDPINIPFGNIEEDHLMLINERGFFDEEDENGLNSSGQSWIGYFDNYGNTTGTLSGGYLGRALPTNNVGQNFYIIEATDAANTENLTRNFDTMLYTVSEYREYAASSPNPSGYVWARDNGLIPSGTSFKYALVTGDDGRNYVTDNDEDGHSNERGYRLHMRYVTGNTIPTDANGNPWRLQGMEFIAATDRPDSLMVGTQLIPLVYEEVYTEDGLSFEDVATGLTYSTIVEVTADDINGNLYTDNGYMLPTDNYKSIKVKFLNQPELKPNTAYRFGYYLNNDSRFNLAHTAYSYWNTDSTSLRYTGDPITAPYANQLTPPTTFSNYLDIIVTDGSLGNVYGHMMNYYPMIRPIVGEETEVDRVAITVDCSNNTDSNAFYLSYGAEEVCNDVINQAVGSSAQMTFIPRAHSVIDHMYIKVIDRETEEIVDEHELTVYDEDDNPEGELEAYDYSIADTTGGHQEVIVERAYYVFYMMDIPADYNYVLSATTHYVEYHLAGIDPAAADVTMTLAPNPATSSVKLNLEGVSGMVNCNIIDMSGRVVYNTNVNADAETIINVASMPAGAYFVRVTNDTFSKIEKLIIK